MHLTSLSFCPFVKSSWVRRSRATDAWYPIIIVKNLHIIVRLEPGRHSTAPPRSMIFGAKMKSFTKSSWELILPVILGIVDPSFFMSGVIGCIQRHLDTFWSIFIRNFIEINIFLPIALVFFPFHRFTHVYESGLSKYFALPFWMDGYLLNLKHHFSIIWPISTAPYCTLWWWEGSYQVQICAQHPNSANCNQ